MDSPLIFETRCLTIVGNPLPSSSPFAIIDIMTTDEQENQQAGQNEVEESSSTRSRIARYDE
jgi:hypothetical protein